MKKLILFLTIASFQFIYGLEVDTKNSSFQWTGLKVTGKHTGKIFIKNAKLTTDKKGNPNGGEFVMDMNSVTGEDLSGEMKTKFLTHIKSEDFFDVGKYPTSKLVIKNLNNNKADGILTIKDKTNPIQITFQKIGNSYTGTMKFDRTKFGMIYGSGSFFKNLGDKMIHNDVILDFKVNLK